MVYLKIYSKMNKTELVAAIAAAGLSKVDSKKALDAALEAVTKELKKGEKVALLGFGTFEVSKRPGREGINPRTKAKIKIAAKNVVKFKAGKELKDAVK
ncbi:MAG: HU family DNA-binding protein [Alloprevotella sp.]|nr:HU family DNA-binding protein [Alloprevotella sp.]